MLARAVLGQQGAGGGGGGPTWIESTEQGNFASNTTPHVITLPSNRATGDLMVAVMVMLDQAATYTTPSGWTYGFNVTIAALRTLNLLVYTRVVDGSESSTVSFTPSASRRHMAVCQLYRGVGSFGVGNALTEGNVWSPDATIAEWTGTPSIASGDLVVSLFAASSGFPSLSSATLGDPAGTTRRDDYGLDNGSDRGGRILTAERTATGSDTAGEWTNSSGAIHSAAAAGVLVLKP